MKNNIIKKNKNINLGLEILRVLLSFWVLVHHCGSIKNITIKRTLFIRAFHVPTFIIISFYFSYKIIQSKNIIKLKERLERLYFPYIIWPIIIWIINNILFYFFRLNRRLDIRYLIMQFIIGRPYQYVLWYQFNLIFITIFFTIISFTFHRNFLFILEIIGLISYILQYSSYNYLYFHKYSYYIYCSVGLIIELFPIAVTGLFLSSIQLIQLFHENRLEAITISFLSLFIVKKYDIFSNILGNFYPGILLNVCAIFSFIIFSQISFNYIKSQKIITFIIEITKYTGGIYYIHAIISNYFKYILLLIKNRTIIGCLFIYLICYIICFLGIRIFKSNKFRYLFY